MSGWGAGGFDDASMGPPPFGSGNSGRVVGICWTVFQLQWGHRLSAVETSLNIFFAHCGHANASMGPPPFGSGNNLPAISIAADLNRASMGPPPFGSGNAPCFSSILPRWYMLQWGHRLSAVETSNVAVMRRRPSSVLQWGHRLSAVETCRSWDGRGPGPIASMGPPPFGSGNAAHCSVSGLSGGASMGPPPFGSGNRRRWCHAVPCLHSFNGATAFRQWKPAAPCGMSGMSRHRFNGATAFRQWKPWTLRPTWLRRRGFNGATAFRQWKPLFVP